MSPSSAMPANALPWSRESYTPTARSVAGRQASPRPQDRGNFSVAECQGTARRCDYETAPTHPDSPGVASEEPVLLQCPPLAGPAAGESVLGARPGEPQQHQAPRTFVGPRHDREWNDDRFTPLCGARPPTRGARRGEAPLSRGDGLATGGWALREDRSLSTPPWLGRLGPKEHCAGSQAVPTRPARRRLLIGGPGRNG